MRLYRSQPPNQSTTRSLRRLPRFKELMGLIPKNLIRKNPGAAAARSDELNNIWGISRSPLIGNKDIFVGSGLLRMISGQIKKYRNWTSSGLLKNATENVPNSKQFRGPVCDIIVQQACGLKASIYQIRSTWNKRNAILRCCTSCAMALNWGRFCSFLPQSCHKYWGSFCQTHF